jgi:hypothetical protein
MTALNAVNTLELKDDKSDDESSKKRDTANGISLEIFSQFPSSRLSHSTTFAIEMPSSKVATMNFWSPRFPISAQIENRNEGFHAVTKNSEQRLREEIP